MKLLVAEPDDFADEARALLATKLDVELRDPGDMKQAFLDYDAVWIRLRRVGANAIPKKARCRVLACPATGLDHIDLDACAAAGIRVVSLRGEVDFLKNVRATAELTMAILLALLRKLPAAVASVQRGEWQRERFRGGELDGKTVGIVGVGRLGTIVAGLCAAFGMKVLGADPRPDLPAGVTRVPLDELLRRSDVVTLHVPLQPATRHLIGGRELGLMKSTAILVNTSRGGIVDETALLQALSTKQIAGAALDVLDGEPDVAAHPLVAYARTHDELLIVPHLGGNTQESRTKTDVFIAHRILEVLA